MGIAPPGRGTNWFKGREAAVCLKSSRTSKKLCGSEFARNRLIGDKVRKIIGSQIVWRFLHVIMALIFHCE
jgi:hypothetical protein